MVEVAWRVVWKRLEGYFWAEAEKVLGPTENVHHKDNMTSFTHRFAIVDQDTSALVQMQLLGYVHDTEFERFH